MVGNTVREMILEQARKAGCYGIMAGDVTNISVLEQMISFIEFYNTSVNKLNPISYR